MITLSNPPYVGSSSFNYSNLSNITGGVSVIAPWGTIQTIDPNLRTPYSDVREGDSFPVVYLTSNPAINAIAGGRRTNAPPWPLLFLFPLFGLMIFAAPILAAVLAAPARPQGLPNGDGSSRNDRLRRQAAGLLVARLASAHSSRRVRPSTPPDGTGARSSRRVHERLASRAPSAGGRGHS